MLTPNRHGGENYRYGFQRQEKDDEVKGEGNSLDFGARMYDSRIGRWFAVDPYFKRYSSYSSYNFVLNNPMKYIDPNGKEVKNGDKAKKEEKESDYNSAKTDFDNQYGGDLNKTKESIGSDKKGWKEYKNARKVYNNAKSEYDIALNNYNLTEQKIKDFQDTEPSKFETVNGLKIKDSKGVVKPYDIYVNSVDPTSDYVKAFGGAKTRFYYTPKDGFLKSYSDVYIANDLPIISHVLAHELGHNVDIVANPKLQSETPEDHNCQLPENENSPYSKTANSWQKSYDEKKFKK